VFPFIINKPYIGDNIGLSMKILLSIIICSSVAGECMPPIPYTDLFKDQYDCLQFGYQESQKRLADIGRTDVNQFGMFIKFRCTPTNTI